MKKMIQLFIEDTPNQLDLIKNAAEQKDWEQVGKIAHRIKPSIDHLSIESMKSLVRKVENTDTTAPDAMQINELCNKVEELLDQLAKTSL